MFKFTGFFSIISTLLLRLSSKFFCLRLLFSFRISIQFFSQSLYFSAAIFYLFIYFLFLKYILLIMLLHFSQYFLPFIPLCPASPNTQGSPTHTLSSCPWVIHISSLASLFPILFLTTPIYFMPTNYPSYSLCLSPHSSTTPPH